MKQDAYITTRTAETFDTYKMISKGNCYAGHSNTIKTLRALFNPAREGFVRTSKVDLTIYTNQKNSLTPKGLY